MLTKPARRKIVDSAIDVRVAVNAVRTATDELKSRHSPTHKKRLTTYMDDSTYVSSSQQGTRSGILNPLDRSVLGANINFCVKTVPDVQHSLGYLPSFSQSMVS